MGVSGLTNYLRGQAVQRVRNPCFYFLEIFKKECEAFLSWLEVHNVQLASVIFDGMFEKRKANTRVGRRFQRVKALAFAKDKLLLSGIRRENASKLHAQELNAGSDPSSISPFRSVLISCLRCRNIEIMVTNGEADATIASRCKELPGAAVLADDSDFFIMGVPLVLMSSLNYVSDFHLVLPSPSTPSSDLQCASPSESEDEFICELFVPESVLACLKLPLSTLLYLSILAGNDCSDQQLTMKFAKGAGFAGKVSNSQQRIRAILTWLQQSQNIPSALQKLFRKQKALHDYEMALKATRLSMVPEPFVTSASPSSNGPSNGTNGLSEPAETSGVFLHRKYWNPVIYSGNETSAALLPLRNRFYRALLRLALDGNCELEVQNIAEVMDDLDVQYEIDMSPANDDFDFGQLNLESSDGSLDHLWLGLDLVGIDKEMVMKLKREVGCGAMMLMLALCMMKSFGLISSPVLVLLLLRQYAVLNHPNWYLSVKSAGIVLPTDELATLSSTFVVVLSWLKVLNKLSGNPLGLAAENEVVFDGYVLALLESEEVMMKDVVDEEKFEVLQRYAKAFSLLAEDM